MSWGSGDIGGPLRKIAAGNPAAIHILDHMAKMLGVDVVDNTPDCPYTHTLMERQQYHMDFLERFHFEQSHNKASVTARLDSLEMRMILAPLQPALEGASIALEGAATGMQASTAESPPCTQFTEEGEEKEQEDEEKGKEVTLRSQEEHEHKQAEHQQEATAAKAKSKFEDPTPACAICLSDFEPGELAMVFKKCGHAFHCKCLNLWLERSSTCPCCRSKLIEEHVSNALGSSTAVAAPSDVAHLLREGSGIAAAHTHLTHLPARDLNLEIDEANRELEVLRASLRSEGGRSRSGGGGGIEDALDSDSPAFVEGEARSDRSAECSAEEEDDDRDLTSSVHALENTSGYYAECTEGPPVEPMHAHAHSESCQCEN